MATARAKEIVRVLKKLGFIEHRQVGSHLTMLRPKDGERVTVPMHLGDIPTGTLIAFSNKQVSLWNSFGA
ncbi:putative RNA binding protein YcfA, dsRBD-like fold, HicA-like mRNA interferase family [Candidatus Fervidibacteria bacterium JGI MDM2 JNZ-1-D12]